MINSKDRKIKFLLVFFTGFTVFIAVAGLVVFNLLLFGPVAWAVFGDYNRTGINLLVNDWNYLDEDFVAKGGDTMAGVLDMNNIEITNVTTNVADLDSIANVNYVDSLITASQGGATYINWGRADCGSDTILYSGLGFGTGYSHAAGGDNDICIIFPMDIDLPSELHNGNRADQLSPATSAGSALKSLPPGYGAVKTFISCAACYRQNSSCYVNYGTHDCSAAPFTQKAYDGYSAAGISESHSMSRERKCLNRNFDTSAGEATGYGAIHYGSRVEDNFGQAAYTPLTFLKCAVCCN